MSCVNVKNVVKHYKINKSIENNQQNVLNGINLEIDRGIIYALIGASGCGKTTLLNCLLGIQKFQSGEIKIFNQKITSKNLSKLAQFIGFMPQQLSLSLDLSVIETLKFFGNLHMMDQNFFEDRLEMISNLLELPSKHKEVRKLSGGQQRRLSLAIAILHDPKFLVLDEPTVGVDFILREKIWTFLQNQTIENKLTVLITTHYLNEAAKAHKCGFMRNGLIIAEGEAKNIMENLEVNSLDEAFLVLCQGREIKKENEKFLQEKEAEMENFKIGEDKKWFRKKVVKGLMMKEWYRLKRHPSGFLSVFIVCTLQITFIYYIIGQIPKDLPLGIIDNSFKNQQYSNINQNHCNNENLSNFYLNSIYEVEKIFFKSKKLAIESFRKNEILGIISISENFSKNIFDDNDELEPVIEVYLDSVNFPFHYFLKHKIVVTFWDFVQKLSENSTVKSYLFIKPMKMEAIYGTLNFEISSNLNIISIVIVPYVINFILSSNIISETRKEGIWNRILLSGGNICEMFLIYFIHSLMMGFLMIIEVFLTLKYIMNFNIGIYHWHVAFVILELSQIGFLHGFFISILFSNIFVVTSLVGFNNMIISILSGMLWPVEAFPDYMKILTNFIPLTFPISFIREIIFKGDKYNVNLAIYTILILESYKIILFIACYFALKKKKFAEIETRL